MQVEISNNQGVEDAEINATDSNGLDQGYSVPEPFLLENLMKENHSTYNPKPSMAKELEEYENKIPEQFTLAQLLKAPARSHNVDDTLQYFADKESGGDYTKKSDISLAYGKYQFLDGTLKEKSEKYGMSIREARTPDGQEKVMRHMLTEYEDRLKKWNLPVTKENLFVVHNLGTTGGIRAIRGTYTPDDISRMRSNIPGKASERARLADDEVVKRYFETHRITKG